LEGMAVWHSVFQSASNLQEQDLANLAAKISLQPEIERAAV